MRTRQRRERTRRRGGRWDGEETKYRMWDWMENREVVTRKEKIERENDGTKWRRGRAVLRKGRKGWI